MAVPVCRLLALMSGLVLALAACAGPSASPGPPRVSAVAPPARSFAARVLRVVDGDTVIAVRRAAQVRVRLIGVDAPESVTPGVPVQCWGRESSALLRRLLPPGTRVRAAYEPGGRRDRYGRDLWDIWLSDGRFLQAVLVRGGAARAAPYPPQVQHAGELARLDRRARAAGAGLHTACRAPPT